MSYTVSDPHDLKRPGGYGHVMNHHLSILLLAGACVAGCTQEHATRAGLTGKEISSLKAYCTGNARAAEAALLETERYSRCCQREGVGGILFDEVYARTYGRLYLVERRLGNNRAAEEYFQKAAECCRRSLAARGRSVEGPRGLQLLIEKEMDSGLRVAWKTE
jgi:hypothetical protein